MSEKRLRQIERRIEKIKEALSKIESLRPGTLTKQYKNPAEKKGAYWQISYTRNLKSHSEYVRPECVAEVRKQITAYKNLKRLTDEWIDLGIEWSKLKMKIDKTKET